MHDSCTTCFVSKLKKDTNAYTLRIQSGKLGAGDEEATAMTWALKITQIANSRTCRPAMEHAVSWRIPLRSKYNTVPNINNDDTINTVQNGQRAEKNAS